jgi:hypothetical protein
MAIWFKCWWDHKERSLRPPVDPKLLPGAPDTGSGTYIGRCLQSKHVLNEDKKKT